MNKHRIILFFLLITAVLAACSTSPETVAVTRVVTQEIPVTVEVTRIVTQPITVEIEKEVEVTRLVEVPVAATPVPENTEPAPPTEEPTAAPTATTEVVAEATEIPLQGDYYTVQSGDTLSTISQATGVSEADIMAANNMTNANVLVVGQELLIPGWTGGSAAAGSQPQPTAPEQLAAPVGANILPNGSFEEGWYYFQGVSEWQLPNGWSLSVNEGTNPYGSGGRYFRPEIRLLTLAHLPPNEQGLFVFDGAKTIKAFKGDAPTHFTLYRDVTLQPGTYRLSISFFPDSVWGYDGQNKVYNGDPLSAEARIIVGDGGTGWQGTHIGNRNTISHDFTINTAQTVRLGGAFRNRFAQSNNGWFIDNWVLQLLETP
ncbi:MAG: hypothetical protein CSB13_12030 [Chloroflexi bacterium]|nr:MAG: hypothetical protein CSB13_12030 [Chloroflexota bacterium]